MHSATHASLWVETCSPPDLGDLSLRPRHHDVIVIGAGVVGLVSAVLLAERGLDVCVLEADTVLGRNTTTFSTVKATVGQGRMASRIKSRLGEQAARTYVQANQGGLALLRRMVVDHGIDCALRTEPHWIYATNPSDVQHLHEERKLLAKFGVGARHVSLQRGVDGTPLPPRARMAFSVEEQVSFHPARYLMGLADRFVNGLGGTLAVGVRATGVQESGDTVRVETSGGELTAGATVLATHVPFLDRGGHFAKLTPTRAYAIAGPIDDGVTAGMTYDIGQQTHSTRTYEYSGVDGLSQRLLIAVGEEHRVGHDEDAMDHYTRLYRWARESYGMRSVAFRWSTQDPSSLDHVPYVGRVSPMDERIFTATGFGGWGMTNGHAAAMVLVGEITEHSGETRAWSHLFDATRIEMARNIGSIIGTNAPVAKALVSDHARQVTGRRRDPEELGAGQSGLFEGPLRTVAAYRDRDGVLHRVSARCTHMGCLVRFNDAEESWDCPCHGSRFSVDGAVMEGPATEPLHPAGGLTGSVDLTKGNERESR